MRPAVQTAVDAIPNAAPTPRDIVPTRPGNSIHCNMLPESKTNAFHY